MSDPFAFAGPQMPPMPPPGMMDPMGMGMPPEMMEPPPPPYEPPPPPAVDPNDPYMGLDPEALLASFKSWFEDDSSHWKNWRAEAEEDFAFRALDQWSEEDKQKLKDEMRVPIVFDRINPIIRSVIGQQVANRQEARYIPREMGDVQVNELLTGAAEWFRDQAAADSEETAGFDDALTCGIGCIETGLDFESDQQGEPRVERIDPLEMIIDCSSRKANALDARRIFRVKTVPLAEAEAMFPDASPSELDAAWANNDASDATKTKNDPGQRYRDEAHTGLDDKDVQNDAMVTLVECQWWEREVFYRVIDPLSGGQEIELSEDDHAALVDRMPALIAQGIFIRPGVRQQRRVYRKAFIGSKVLSVEPLLDPKRFSYMFITGFRDRNTGTWFGLVKAMKDPQRWANKWLSQTLHILNSQAGAGLMMEGEQREDPDKFETDWAKPNSIVQFKRGALQGGLVQPKPQPALPMGYFQLMEWAASAAREASGVNLEQLGMREAVQPGVLEYQRRQSGVQVLAGLFDSLRRYRLEQARLLLTIIQTYLSDGRLIRINGDETEQLVHLTRDSTLGDYDVIVDDAPTAPNQKEANWQIIQSIFPLLQPAAMESPGVLMAVLRHSPLPESAIAEFEGVLMPPEPTEEEMMQEEEARALEMEAQREMIRSMMAEAAKDEAQVQNYLAQAQLNTAKAQEIGGGVDQAQITHLYSLAQMHQAKAQESRAKATQTQLAMVPPVPAFRPPMQAQRPVMARPPQRPRPTQRPLQRPPSGAFSFSGMR